MKQSKSRKSREATAFLYRKLRKVILNICDVAGFEIRGPIVLMDKKSRKIWR